MRVHSACAEEGIAEGFYDRRHGVSQDHPLETFRDGRDRVDDRRGVHQQGYAEGHQKTQVTVLGGYRVPHSYLNLRFKFQPIAQHPRVERRGQKLLKSLVIYETSGNEEMMMPKPSRKDGG